MQPIFVAKYLSIKWSDKDNILKITESINLIKIEVTNSTSFHMEIQAYNRENGLDMRVAFHILDSESNIEPYFQNADGDNITLLKVIDPNNKKVWWIEDGSWSYKYKCRMSELWNHAGITTVYFGNITCNINIRAISFTKEQLKQYLEDFKNDFWWLILKKNSLTQVEAKNSNEQIKILNQETIDSIKNFMKYTQYVLKNPKKELKEIQGIKDLKKVKPVAKTFMEIATGGIKKKLTSRDAIESFNIAENRYIHYSLYQVYKIVQNMTKASLKINEFYQDKVKSEQKRIKKFKNIKIIDKEVVENTIKNLEEKKYIIKNNFENIENIQDKNIKEQCEKELNTLTLQDHINQAIQNQILSQNNIEQFQQFHIKLERRQNDYKNKIQFFGKVKNPSEQDWHGIKTNDLFSLEFNLNLFGFLEENQEFIVNAIINYYNIKTNKNRNMHKFYFQYISELKPLNYNKSKKTVKYQTLYIKLNKKQRIYENKIQFWGKARLENQNEWQQLKKGNLLSLEFDKNILNHVLQENTEYKITAYIERSEYNKQNGGTIHKRYFKYVTNIEQKSKSPLSKDLDYYIRQKEQLEKTNWIRPLSNKEKQEQEKEKQSIQKQIELLNEDLKTTNKYITKLEPLIMNLKSSLNQFEKLSISKDSYFPNSMTFVQNPHYQGVYKYYQEIKDIVGIDENLFLSIQKIDKIGVLDIPTLYERWCFLQIIKILIDQYHFIPDENWKQTLSEQMRGDLEEVRENVRNITIIFINHQLERKIILHYEKELNGYNSKRPDYFLEIISLRTNKRHNLIMDAKFREDVKVKNLIEELYYHKGYSQNNRNTVFILHPDTKKSIEKMNPSNWGEDAYYGEVQMFDYRWDNDEFPNHKYGSILLSPIKDNIGYGNYLDNLQRLIGMSLQYQLEDNNKEDITLRSMEKDYDIIDPIPKVKTFCLKCGSHKIKTISSGFSRSQKGKYYQMICEDCNHNFIYFYCWSCKHRLIKNGSYWSYHSFQPLEPLDIQCPNCAKFWHQHDNYNSLNTKHISEQKEYKEFKDYDEAMNYIRMNIGTSLVRKDETTWIIKI